ncbi:MAG: choice-of-anchor X domain-containing protein [Candidatus Rifleibacteriota bacterium]
MKKIILLLALIVVAFTSTGCIQEALVIPVATVSGKVVVPAGKVPTGIKVTVAGESTSSYVNEKGEYSLEFRRSGRFLLIARGREFDVNYVWVDAEIEKTVSAADINVDEKIVGEGLWVATIVDFPTATKFWVTSVSPLWSPDSQEMFDDGTHGDKLANDGIFTLRLTNLKTGSQQYSLKYLEEGSETPKTGIKDPHREGERNSYSELIIPESTVKLARGQVTSDLTGINYSEVKLSTKKGSRTIFCDSDGVYSMPMEGNGREYLVFRSANLHIRAIPVDLTTVTVYDVPTTTLSSKKSGEVKLIMVKSDFAEVTNPVVVADFTNWQPQQMYDDATNGDEVAGDGVYTRLFTGIAPGYHKYAFNITDTSQVKDPYQESGDSEYSIILVK